MSDDEKPQEVLEGEIMKPDEKIPPAKTETRVVRRTTLGKVISAWGEQTAYNANRRATEAAAGLNRAVADLKDSETELEMANERLAQVEQSKRLLRSELDARIEEAKARTKAAKRSSKQDKLLDQAERSELEVRILEAKLKKKKLKEKIDRGTDDIDQQIAAINKELEDLLDAAEAKRKSGSGWTEAEENEFSRRLQSLTDKRDELYQKKEEDEG